MYCLATPPRTAPVECGQDLMQHQNALRSAKTKSHVDNSTLTTPFGSLHPTKRSLLYMKTEASTTLWKPCNIKNRAALLAQRSSGLPLTLQPVPTRQ